MQIREKSRFFTEVRFHSLSNFLMIFRTLTSVNEAQGNENAGRAKNVSWKNIWKSAIPRGSNFIQIQHLAMKTSVGQGRKKRLRRGTQKIERDDFTAPGNENKGFDSKKRTKTTQNVELSSKYRLQMTLKRAPRAKPGGTKNVQSVIRSLKKQAFRGIS